MQPLIGQRGRQWIKTFQERNATAKFLRFDCSKTLPFGDGTIDHILASHFIEHHYIGDARRIMRDWWRILKPGATLHVLVPDLTSLIAEYSKNVGSPDAAGDFFQSLTVRPLHAQKMFNSLVTVITNGDTDHRWMYDVHSLRHELEAAGFSILPEICGPSADWRRNDPHQVNLVARKEK
jgi:predicted SAM-dependent methyltransferase